MQQKYRVADNRNTKTKYKYVNIIFEHSKNTIASKISCCRSRGTQIFPFSSNMTVSNTTVRPEVKKRKVQKYYQGNVQYIKCLNNVVKSQIFLSLL